METARHSELANLGSMANAGLLRTVFDSNGGWTTLAADSETKRFKRGRFNENDSGGAGLNTPDSGPASDRSDSGNADSDSGRFKQRPIQTAADSGDSIRTRSMP